VEVPRNMSELFLTAMIKQPCRLLLYNEMVANILACRKHIALDSPIRKRYILLYSPSFECGMTNQKKPDQRTKKLQKEVSKLPKLGSADGLNQNERAKRAEQARQILAATFELYQQDKGITEARLAWHQAAQQFHRAVEEAYPPGFWEDFSSLKQKDPGSIETVVQFLEADPWFFRSGYVKADIIRFLNQCQLSESYRSRLQYVVLLAVASRDRREFRSYCRLAKKIYCSELHQKLLVLSEYPDCDVRRRAKWVLEACKAVSSQ
jgi:hypothetical protein